MPSFADDEDLKLPLGSRSLLEASEGDTSHRIDGYDRDATMRARRGYAFFLPPHHVVGKSPVIVKHVVSYGEK